MREFKFIFHAYLLLLAIIIFLICLRGIFTYSQKDNSETKVSIENLKINSNIFPKGKQLFLSNCASCHILNRNFTGPSLCGFESRGPWSEREKIYQWIRNPQEFIKRNEYTRELKESFSGVMMMSSPNLSNEEIDEIINYINSACTTPLEQVVIAEN